MSKHSLRYFFYKFLNRSHSRFEKTFLQALVRVFFFITKTPASIGNQVIGEINKDEFKLVFRRLSWLLTNSWIGLCLVKDDYFDFSIGLGVDASISAYCLVQRSSKVDGIVKHITLAQFASGILEAQVPPGSKVELGDMLYPEYDALYLSHLRSAELMLSELDENSEERHADNAAKPKGGQSASSEGGFNPLMRDAESLFTSLVEGFSRQKLSVFVISGTFLGLIRDKGFIKHDYDIDLGILESDFDERFMESLNELHGFKSPCFDYPCYRNESESSSVSYVRMSTPALIKLMHKTGVQVDIFVHFEDEGLYWHGSSLHRWDNRVFGFKMRDFMGVLVSSPDDYDLYLRENYGDWKTPVKDFNCSTGTPNLVDAGTCKSACFILKREFYGQ